MSTRTRVAIVRFCRAIAALAALAVTFYWATGHGASSVASGLSVAVPLTVCFVTSTLYLRSHK